MISPLEPHHLLVIALCRHYFNLALYYMCFSCLLSIFGSSLCDIIMAFCLYLELVCVICMLNWASVSEPHTQRDIFSIIYI